MDTRQLRWTPTLTDRVKDGMPTLHSRKKPAKLTARDFYRMMELAALGADQLYSEKEYEDARRLLGRMSAYYKRLKGEEDNER